MKCRSVLFLGIAMTALGAAAVQAEEKAEAAKAEAAKPDAKAKPAEMKCEFVPGSRIRRKPPADCDSGPPGVRSFSSEEIQNTGETNVTDALRKLDPRFY